MNRKKVTHTAHVKKVHHKKDEEINSTLIIGLASLVFALGSLIGYQQFMALVAIGLGGLTVWLAVRYKDFHHLFLGVAGMLISITAIWAYSMQQVMNTAQMF